MSTQSNNPQNTPSGARTETLQTHRPQQSQPLPTQRPIAPATERLDASPASATQRIATPATQSAAATDRPPRAAAAPKQVRPEQRPSTAQSSAPPATGDAAATSEPSPGPSAASTARSNLEATEAPRTELERLADALRTTQRNHRESRRRFHDFILAASDWVWETNESAAITFISDRITEVIGRPSGRLVGRSLFELGTEVRSGGPSLRDAMASRRPFRGIALEIADDQGRRRYCRISGLPAFDDRTGRFLGFRGAGIDCTAEFEANAAAAQSQAKLERIIEDLKSRHERMKQALATAEASIHAKSEFLASVSHELRTPLNAIIGFTEIMEQQMYGPLGDSRYHEYSKNVLQSGRHLLSIINDLLDMAKVEAGKLELSEGSIDVGALIDESVSLVRTRVQEEGLNLTLRLPKDGPLLWGDARLVKQMLLNLLTNAIKFTQSGGSIVIEGRETPEHGYAILVSDTGIGIAEDDIQTVLSPFGQVESSLSRTHDGTGLGLPLVQAMIQLHNGTMQIHSTVGSGTIVTLTFPAERVIDRDTQPNND